jgi:hypothetical protein
MRVKINNAVSESFPVPSGTPQGRTVSCLLANVIGLQVQRAISAQVSPFCIERTIVDMQLFVDDYSHLAATLAQSTSKSQTIAMELGSMSLETAPGKDEVIVLGDSAAVIQLLREVQEYFGDATLVQDDARTVYLGFTLAHGQLDWDATWSRAISRAVATRIRFWQRGFFSDVHALSANRTLFSGVARAQATHVAPIAWPTPRIVRQLQKFQQQYLAASIHVGSKAASVLLRLALGVPPIDGYCCRLALAYAFKILAASDDPLRRTPAAQLRPMLLSQWRRLACHDHSPEQAAFQTTGPPRQMHVAWWYRTALRYSLGHIYSMLIRTAGVSSSLPRLSTTDCADTARVPCTTPLGGVLHRVHAVLHPELRRLAAAQPLGLPSAVVLRVIRAHCSTVDAHLDWLTAKRALRQYPIGPVIRSLALAHYDT